MDYKRIFLLFMAFGVLPIMLSALSVSFVLLDLQLLNPIYWNKAARVASTVWLVTILMTMLVGMMQAYTD